MIRVYTRMVADLFHPGHIAFLQAARQLGDHLTVFVLPDTLVQARKGRFPIMTQLERAQILSACRYVDAVLLDAPFETTPEFMQRQSFDLFALACANSEEMREKYAHIHTLPRDMIHELKYTQGISTSQIISRISYPPRVLD